MPELNTNTLVLLVLILSILLFDFFKRRKSDSKELMNTEGNSNNKKKIFIRIFLLIALVTTTFFLLNQKDSKVSDITLSSSLIEDFHKELSAIGSREVGIDGSEKFRDLNIDNYINIVSPLFEKYYNCLECVEAICYTHPYGGLTDTYGRYKISHFTRAIELGSRNLYIYIQEMRYKNYVGDKYGAIERSNQIQTIIDNSGEIDLKPYFKQIGDYYLYQADIHNLEYSLSNSYQSMALQYYEKAMESVSRTNPLDIKNIASDIGRRMVNYSTSFANRSGDNYYWWHSFPQEERRELCRFMSRLGSLGAKEIYELIEDLCSN